MTWTVDASGTKTATVPSTCTFTNSSSSIGVTNTCAAGDMVVFTTTSALPTNFTVGTTYFVIATGLSSSNIEVAATPGGTAISAGSAGTGTQTGTFEHVLDIASTNATYVFAVDTVNMVNVDLTTFRIYDELDTTNQRQAWKGTYQNVQINLAKESPPIAISAGAQFTIQQLAGTGRAYPWVVRRI